MSAIITLSILGILVLYLGLYKLDRAIIPIAILGLLGAGAALVIQSGGSAEPLYKGMVLFDSFALVFGGLMIALTALIFLISKGYFEAEKGHLAEYYALMIFSLTGGILVVSFYHLAMLFIGLEIMSVALYILAGIRKRDFASNEASLKYFLMGAFSTGFLLFGIALIYGASGSFDVAGIQAYVQQNTEQISPLFYIGILLLIVGLGFKVGAAPFHFWVPDVYDGSPILITIFMSTVVKVAAIATFLRLFWLCFEPLQAYWGPLLLGMSICTLFIGNITALMQQSFKRMLAYSSISHVGYMLFALFSMSGASANYILVYVFAYSLSSIVGFGSLILVKRAVGSDHFTAFNGLAGKNPLLAFTLTIAMLSFAGIPFTMGFMGKFMMFSAVMNTYHYVLLILAVVNAAIGVFYYFRVIVAMYFQEGEAPEIRLNNNYRIVFILAALLTILLGVYPALVSDLISL